ncbi:porin family protein [Photobacterium sp. ZSDE20]|uniref:outer membrane protein n=1 Tax=Vibrio TaxID=662 RepID=UPI002364378F|nr:porin family protein [Photobacterium sp. ZSDE20]
MKKLVLAICVMASAPALASNEMYALGGFGMDSGDVGGQFTFGSQIMQSNWYVESTLLAITVKDSSVSTDSNNEKLTRKEKFDSLVLSLTPTYKHSFNDNFSVFGKFGALYSHSDTKLEYISNKGSEVTKGSHGDLGLTYGIGAEYKSIKPIFGNSKLLTRVGYDWYEYGGSSSWYTNDSVLGVQTGFTF